MKMPTQTSAIEPVMLGAEPEPIQIDLQRTAVVVIDMQNAFASKGGMLDLMGLDVSENLKVVEVINKINGAARARRVSVIYLAHVYSPDFQESGSSDSPNWYKESSLHLWRDHPEWRDKLLIRGTWGSQIIEKLKPEKGDIFIEKRRYSAFFGTDLDIILKTYDIKFLIFTGVATNICVETSIRDSFNLGYFPILISDAAAPAGEPFIQEATIYNIKLCFGWVTSSENIIRALQRA